MVVLDLGPMEQLLSDTTGLGQTGEIIVGTRLGDKVRHLLPPRNDPEITEVPLASTPAMAEALRGHKGFVQTTDYRGVEVVAAYQPVEYRGWGMVAKIDAAEATPRSSACALSSWRWRRSFCSSAWQPRLCWPGGLPDPSSPWPRRQPPLRRAILRRVTVTSSDEIGRLGTTFNHMTEELAASYATLEQRVADRTRELAQANAELAREIVERKRAAALIQSEKLASLGQLAAGMAHEINNPIAYVTNNLAVLRRDMRAAMSVLDTYREGHDSLARVAPDLATAAARLEQDIDLAYIRENFLRDFDLAARSTTGARYCGEFA